MDTVDQAKRNADLLLPRLEALRSTVGSGRLHDVLQHVALVANYRWMIDNPGRNRVEDVASETIKVCQKAERFMLEIGGKHVFGR